MNEILDLQLYGAVNQLDAHIHGTEISPHDVAAFVEHLESWERVMRQKADAAIQEMQEKCVQPTDPVYRRLAEFLRNKA